MLYKLTTSYLVAKYYTYSGGLMVQATRSSPSSQKTPDTMENAAVRFPITWSSTAALSATATYTAVVLHSVAVLQVLQVLHRAAYLVEVFA